MKKRTLIFFVVFIISLFFVMNQNLSSQVPEPDSLALVALYDSTDGANWTDNTNWLTGPVSDWFGVTVSDGRVTVVELRTNNLVGTIPAEIGNLTELIKLDLYTNQLTGSIPPEIGNLANLIELNFHNNQLIGNIPSEIGNLINLEYIYMRNNQLTGPIPPEIGNLTNLTDLYLNRNQLTDAIPPEIGNLINLRNLDFYKNELSGNIPAELCNLINLSYLNLSNNQLTDAIPSEIGNLISLRELNLSSNELSGNIPTELYNLINLTYLSLSYNQLTGSISPDIGKFVNIVSLYLSSNMLTDSIPAEIGNLKNLRALNIRFNQLSGTIPIELYSLTNLVVINFSRNQLIGTIPPQIGNLVNLTEFSVPENQMYGEIPDEIGNLLDLKYLWLNDNEFAGAVPNGVGNMTYLITLRLDNNQFTDLPDISSDTSLTNVQIQDNQFTFEDIEPNIGIEEFIYAPQDSVGEELDTTLSQGSSLVLLVSVGGTANQYQWIKDGVDIPGADNNSYTVSSVDYSDAGSYLCRITNTIASELTLYSRPVTVTVDDVVGVTERTTQIPKAFALYQNYPNPFNPATTIRYDLPKASLVVLKIYNLFGQEIRTLVNEFQSEGEKTILWDGSNKQGQKVSSGIYVCQIKADSFSKSNKMIIAK